MPHYVPTFLTSAYNTWKAEREGMSTVLQHGGQLYDLVLARWRLQPQLNHELQVQELNRTISRLTQDLTSEREMLHTLRAEDLRHRQELAELRTVPNSVRVVLNAETDRMRTWLKNAQNPRLAGDNPLHYLKTQLLKRINRIHDHDLLKHPEEPTHGDHQHDPLVLLGDSAAVCPAG